MCSTMRRQPLIAKVCATRLLMGVQVKKGSRRGYARSFL